jgi:triosephosphate isomerase
MRVPLVAGNWKMNKTIAEARQLVSEMVPPLNAVEGVDRVLCPPFSALLPVSSLLEGTEIGLGAQNMYWETSGAYTGEESPGMIAELCQYVILGHSERRAYFGETDSTVNRKVIAALKHELIPIVCVGETLEENEAGRTKEVVSRQIEEGLAGLDLPEINGSKGNALIVAYEPVWAIGTGRAATSEGANAVIADVIRTGLIDLFGQEITDRIRVLYGGSVTSNNAAEYFAEPDIDGALVGGASLKIDEFVKIAEATVF